MCRFSNLICLFVLRFVRLSSCVFSGCCLRRFGRRSVGSGPRSRAVSHQGLGVNAPCFEFNFYIFALCSFSVVCVFGLLFAAFRSSFGWFGVAFPGGFASGPRRRCVVFQIWYIRFGRRVVGTGSRSRLVSHRGHGVDASRRFLAPWCFLERLQIQFLGDLTQTGEFCTEQACAQSNKAAEELRSKLDRRGAEHKT